ncbi:MAG TPA: hypothetical protein VF169_01845 [Albitalea sp.]|uniref:glycine-rich domain-containing protein n=1 Tax=Piscinibacter sp. TaxID=1903157 RepID=UPI002ED0A229
MQLHPLVLVRGLLLLTLAAIWIVALPRGRVGLAFVSVLVVVAAWKAHAAWWRASARKVVATYPLPAFLRDKLRARYPQLDDAQVRDVERALRQFFAASAAAGGKFVAMPSKVVDALWHEFILHTRGYEAFCRRAFGRLLHHTPAEVMPPDGKQYESRRAGLRRAWYWSCREEGIDPRKPDRLPLLFALDTTLAIAGGYKYVPDCKLLGSGRGDTHCAAGFGCGSSCGSSGDGGSSDGCSSSGCSSCGGGD